MNKLLQLAAAAVLVFSAPQDGIAEATVIAVLHED